MAYTQNSLPALSNDLLKYIGSHIKALFPPTAPPQRPKGQNHWEKDSDGFLSRKGWIMGGKQSRILVCLIWVDVYPNEYIYTHIYQMYLSCSIPYIWHQHAWDLCHYKKDLRVSLHPFSLRTQKRAHLQTRKQAVIKCWIWQRLDSRLSSYQNWWEINFYCLQASLSMIFCYSCLNEAPSCNNYHFRRKKSRAKKN